MANIIASRITELEYLPVFGKTSTARDLLEVHLRSQHLIPVDVCTDTMNLFELICFSKSLPNDKHHRVGILALREDRLTRRIRNIIHLPTTVMLADQLTKKMLSPIYMHFLTTGEWKIELNERSIILRRVVRRPATYTEQDLKDNNYEVSSDDVGESLELDDDEISLL
eukprot:5769728-Pyramimonas_sp.AAC.1